MQVIPSSGKWHWCYHRCFSRHQLWHLWLSSAGGMHGNTTHLLLLHCCFLHTCHRQAPAPAHASAYDLQQDHALHASLQVTARQACTGALADASRKCLWCKTGVLTRSSLSFDSQCDRRDTGAKAAAASACFCMILEMHVHPLPSAALCRDHRCGVLQSSTARGTLCLTVFSAGCLASLL